MKIHAVRVRAVRSPLRTALRTHRGALGQRVGVRVEIEGVHAGAPVRGVGEALPLPSMGTETRAECERTARALAERLRGREGPLSRWLDELAQRAPGAPAARSAFDLALHDCASRARACSVSALLCGAGPTAPDAVAVNAVLGDADPAGVARALQRGYGTVKLKLAADAGADEVARVAALRRALGPAPRLRLDPNGAWTPEQALRLLEKLAPLDIELCEQPVPARDLEGFARLQRETPIALAADESLALTEGRAACASGALGRFAMLKLAVLGGLEEARSLAVRSARAGVCALVTTSFDGPVGTAAALALAAAVGDRTRAHGLDAAHWMREPFPAALIAQGGRLRTRRAPGWLRVA